MLNGMSPTDSRIVMHHLISMFYTEFPTSTSRRNRMRAFRDLKRYVKANCPSFSARVAFVLKHVLRLRVLKLTARAHATIALNKGCSSPDGAASYQALFGLVAEVLKRAGTASGDTILEMIYI